MGEYVSVGRSERKRASDECLTRETRMDSVSLVRHRSNVCHSFGNVAGRQ
jgi:hypothetical protein